MKVKFVALLFSILFLSICYANSPFHNRHIISFSGGLKPNYGSSSPTSELNVGNHFHFSGFIGYEYVFKNNLSFNAMLGIQGITADIIPARLSNTSITYFLVGLRYYPPILSSGQTGKFYTGLNVGGFVGSAEFGQVKTYIDDNGLVELPGLSYHIQSNQYGGQITMGFDFILSQWIKTGPMLSYFFIPSFNNLFGDNNHNGAVISINLGIML